MSSMHLGWVTFGARTALLGAFVAGKQLGATTTVAVRDSLGAARVAATSRFDALKYVYSALRRKGDMKPYRRIYQLLKRELSKPIDGFQPSGFSAVVSFIDFEGVHPSVLRGATIDVRARFTYDPGKIKGDRPFEPLSGRVIEMLKEYNQSRGKGDAKFNAGDMAKVDTFFVPRSGRRMLRPWEEAVVSFKVSMFCEGKVKGKG